MIIPIIPFDPNCRRHPEQIPGYQPFAIDEYEHNRQQGLESGVGAAKAWHELSDAERTEAMRAYVAYNEGTYNPDNGHFLCDECYIAAGMPSAPGLKGWVCP